MSVAFEVQAMVRGYHKYKDIWEAKIGENLQCQREPGNVHDLYAVSVMNSGLVVGHVPKKISSTCSLFLRRGGSILCTVTGGRRYSADLAEGGLEVPCTLKFQIDSGSITLLNKAEKLVVSALSTNSLHQTEQNSQKSKHQMEHTLLSTSTKRLKLSVCCVHEDIWKEELTKEEMLSDVSIQTAQSLIKKQFPQLNGLQPTVYQQQIQQGRPNESSMDQNCTHSQLQIIHCHGNHWITASNVGCLEGNVNIYDSLYDSVDETTRLIVSSLFSGFLRCVSKPLQKQKGVTDCGLYAIAVSTAIAYGKDPSELKFKQEAMREHLLKCFKNEFITLFPCI